MQAASSTAPASAFRMVKCEFHSHASEDRCDALNYNARQLVERAAALKFEFLALTLHRFVYEERALFEFAGERGVLMVPSGELKVGGVDILAINIAAKDARSIRSFADLRAYRKDHGGESLVIAPHPFYHFGGSMGKILEKHIDCFDAVEICHLHTRFLDPNHRAIEVALEAGLPLLATSDVHEFPHFGTHYCRVRVAKGPLTWAAIQEGVLAGAIENVSPAIAWPRLLRELSFIGLRHPIRRRLDRRPRLTDEEVWDAKPGLL